MAKKKKVISGPVVQTPIEEPEIQKTEEIQEETQPEETIQEEVEEESVTEEHAASGEIDKDDLGYTIYTADNTKQAEIPLKYKIWSAVVLIAMCIFGYFLATKNTYIPVNNVEVTVEVNDNDSSFMVLLDDLEHSQVDLFYDNAHLALRPKTTSAGLLYSDLKPGQYTVHILDVRRSYINYGVRTVTMGSPADVKDLTELVAKAIRDLPDEGNKLSICNDLIVSFLNAATPGCVDIAAREKELIHTNNVAMGFEGEPKLENESVWFNIFKKNGLISEYLKKKGTDVTVSNYSAIYTAIANGIKEGIK